MIGASAQATTPPNIILILCDDLGYADVGFNGSKDIRTPELDRLAERGTICTSAYVAHPFCGPSRMGLMSGRYPHMFGAPYNLPNSGHGIEEYNKLGIPVGETLISTVLQKAGYFTGAIGKWHMGIAPEYHPNKRGFDEYFGFLGGGHAYFPADFAPKYERQRKAGAKHINEYYLPLERNGVAVDEQEYITDALSREAVRFVETATAKKKPFFLYLAYNAPHSPLEAKEEDMAKFPGIQNEKRRIYAGMVFAVDRGVGALVKALKKTGTYDNTLIVFLSDNGGKEVLGANNGPLREGKGSTHEGGFRVPMFLHWPAKGPAGRRFDHPVSSLDLYPTFAGLAGATAHDTQKLAGKNIWPDVLAGRSPRQGEMIYAVRHRNGYSDVGARRDDWKICRIANKPWQLFHIANDIGENRELAKQHPERLTHMVAEVEKWSKAHTEPRWFNSQKERDMWKETNMPPYEKTFRIE